MNDLPLAVVALIAAIQTAFALIPAYWITLGVMGRTLRAIAERPWIERARIAWPMQAFVGYAICFSGVVAYFVQYGSWKWSEGDAPEVAGWTAFATAVLVSVPAMRNFRFQIYGETPSWRTVCHSTAFTWIVLYWALPLMLLMFTFRTHQLGFYAFLLCAVNLLIGLILTFGGSHEVMRRLGVANPATAKLQSVVERAAARSGIRTPDVLELSILSVNAWAFPTIGRIYVSKRMVDALSDDELETIVLHEMGHLQETRGQIARRLIILPLFAGLAILPAVGGTYGMKAVWSVLLFAYVIIFFLRKMSLRLEVAADDFASRNTQSPATYARALEAIYRLNLIPPVLRKGIPTHPELYDRMLAEGVQPGYERPPPPSRIQSSLYFLLFLLFAVLGFVAGYLVTKIAVEHVWPISTLYV